MDPVSGSYNDSFENVTEGFGNLDRRKPHGKNQTALMQETTPARLECTYSTSRTTPHPHSTGHQERKGNGMNQQMVITALANDTKTGNSNITNCTLQLDGGLWKAMNMTNVSAYDATIQNLSFNAGYLNAGSPQRADKLHRCRETTR